jgi:hypothetical protein
MGRQIRRVPPNWNHPVTKDDYGRMRLQPMFDERFEEAEAEWLANFDRIRRGDMTDFERECYPRGLCEWANDEGRAPDPNYYRPWKDEDATWFQLWETVSEGTPVSPPFETKEELAYYLAENGDEWDQKRCHKPDWESLWGGVPGVSGWGIERARRFVFGSGWAPSMIISDGRVITNPGDMVA